MALHRWPTDKPGKPAAHTISWQQHQGNLRGKQAPAPVPTAPGGAPALAQPLPQPVDPTYQGDVGTAERNYQQTLAGLTTGRQAGLAEYGFTEAGQGGALAFDPNNPFSRAALLKKNYDTSRTRAGNQMASGGQLYSGAYQNQQDLINRGQLQGEDTLQKSLTQWLLQNTAAQARAGTGYQNALTAAEAARTARAPSSPLYEPTVTPEPVPAAGGVSATPPGGATATKPRKPLTIKAGPGVRATRQTTVSRKRKGRNVTYTTAIKGP